MKKLIAIVISVAMLLATSVTAFAVPATLPELLTDNSIASTRNLDVPVDIQVDVEQTGTFVDGPVDATIVGNGISADYKATIYMSDVRSTYTTWMNAATLLVAGVGDLPTQLANCRITGGFTIKIVYPDTAVVPNDMLTGTALYGFNAAAANAFEETAPRTVADGASGTKELTITLSVKSPYILASDMTANLETYLPDITLTCAGVNLTADGENKVIGTITGQTLIHDALDPSNLVATINYTGKQGTAAGVDGTEISEIVNVSHYSGGINAGPGTSSGTVVVTPPAKENITITVDIPNAEDPEPIVIPSTEKNPTINIDELTEEIAPQREGFAFGGFYDSPTYNNKLEGEVAVTENTTIYARWINTTVPEIFEADNHIKYINGYPDETVRPEANITREEVATIFYRLLKEEVRAELETTENDFIDVEADRWSNTAISTMAAGEYITGYPDNTFRPEANITRAELATMTNRFLDAAVSGERTFNDIDGHWAEESIISIANNEWILGYEDGSFRPDAYITRAEAITIINRILVRYVNEHGLTGDEKDWTDNDENAWYYHAIIEASNEHDYSKAENGYHEIWTAE